MAVIEVKFIKSREEGRKHKVEASTPESTEVFRTPIDYPSETLIYVYAATRLAKTLCMTEGTWAAARTSTGMVFVQIESAMKCNFGGE